MTTRKQITIPDELAEYVERTNLNLSWFVQEKLKEKISGGNKSIEYIKNILLTSDYDDWIQYSDLFNPIKQKCFHNDYKEIYVYKKDVSLRLESEYDCENDPRIEAERRGKHFQYDDETRQLIKELHNYTFNWASEFIDPRYWAVGISVYYNISRVDYYTALVCDGGRFTIVVPHPFREGDPAFGLKEGRSGEPDTLPLYLRPIEKNLSQIISRTTQPIIPPRIKIG
jgi:hypothetical protein